MHHLLLPIFPSPCSLLRLQRVESSVAKLGFRRPYPCFIYRLLPANDSMLAPNHRMLPPNDGLARANEAKAARHCEKGHHLHTKRRSRPSASLAFWLVE